MPLIDTHAHLDQDDFDPDREAVLQRARAAGVERVIVVGVTATSSRHCVELAASDDLLRAAVGIQPNYTAQAQPGDWDQILSLIDAPGVVALGETGLDCHWNDSPLDVQRDYFDRHLRLSQERDLPFIVHLRESEAEVLEQLREARRRGALRGVMHSYTGTLAGARECVDLGLHISFAGMVTYKKSDELRAIAAQVPIERLLVETDSPYLAPQPVRGRRNEPAHVAHTVAVLAQVRGEEPTALGERLAENARLLFRLSH